MRQIDPAWGITIMRLAAALVLLRAGWVKWLGGLPETAGALTEYGVPMPATFALASAAFDVLVGVALASGWLTRAAGVLCALRFAAAFLIKARFGLFVLVYVDILMMAAGVLFALAGPGRIALDRRRRPGV
jgi:uncharacterized membrane protein YphA (DoxX/SURF4 family)